MNADILVTEFRDFMEWTGTTEVTTLGAARAGLAVINTAASRAGRWRMTLESLECNVII